MDTPFSLKEVTGLLSVALTFIAYGVYIHAALCGKTRPHMYSWIVWGIVNAIVFMGQYVGGAGAGSWVAGVSAALCFVIVALSVWQGDRNITRTDRIALAAALATIPLWHFSSDPLAAVILATVIYILGSYPTFRKSWHKPHDENLFTWSVAGCRSVLSFFAIENYTLVTTISPVAMTLVNAGGAVLLVLRRYALKGARVPAA